MEKEIVIRDFYNKRIKKMYKYDISKEIHDECRRNFEEIIYHQSQQISELFGLIDTKHTYGILSEIVSAVIGIDDFNDIVPKYDNVKEYNQYNSCMDKIHYGLVNLTTQLIFALEHIDDKILDQVFIKKTIEAIVFLNHKYINYAENNILHGQKEFVNGQIKRLIDLYNQRLNHALELCNQNDTWWARATIFWNSIQNGCSNFEALSNVLINSTSQFQYSQYILSNRLDINYKEIPCIDKSFIKRITDEDDIMFERL